MEWINSNKNKMRERINRWTDGTTPLPGRYIFGAPCLNNHARNGKTVRYKSNNCCILCTKASRKDAHCKKLGRRDLTAIQVFEERANKEDDDPLF